MSTVVDDMLKAAAEAAGAQWGTVSSDLETFARNLARNSAGVAADLQSGQITPTEARVELDELEDQADIIRNYAEQAAKLAAEQAINAAVNVLWLAIQKAPL